MSSSPPACAGHAEVTTSSSAVMRMVHRRMTHLLARYTCVETSRLTATQVTRTTRSIRTRSFAEALALPTGPRLCLLGKPAVLSGNRSVPLRLRPKAVALLTYLALADGEVSRHELARLLFPEAEGALATLRWHLAHLRSAAPPFIGQRVATTRNRVELSVLTDAALFEARADAGSRSPATPGPAGVPG